MDDLTIKVLEGQIIISIEGMTKNSEEVIFNLQDGRKFRLYHSQDCCESVSLEDVCGDVVDLINSPITDSSEVSSKFEADYATYTNGMTWTFYRFSTTKGTVILRWYGTSNMDYYSESVDFEEIKNG